MPQLNRWVRWTSEEDEKLKSLAGILSVAEIAETLNRTLPAVSQRASLLEISMCVGDRKWRYVKKKEVELAELLMKRHKTRKDAADAMGIPYGRFQHIIKYYVLKN